MATDRDNMDKLWIEYEDSLKDITIFDLKYPNIPEGYNALIDIAERKLARLINLGAVSPKPLPPYKK
jgi:hypothetical protein